MSTVEEDHQAIIAPRPRAALWRRLLLCRFDLCDLWYRKEEGGRQHYACAGCERTSMARDLPRPGVPGSIFPWFDVYVPMPSPPSGGPIETRPDLPTGGSAARRMPQIHNEMPAAGEPVIGYVSQNGWRIFGSTDGWSTTLYRDPRDLAPRGGIVEVEVRVRRVIEG